MPRPILALYAAMVLTLGTALWAEDAAAPAATPAAVPAAAATPPAAVPVAAAPAPAAPATPPPPTIEDRLKAVEALAKVGSDSANEASFNAGDNCWVLVSSALVLLMTLPGLALFYGGMVRSKNVLATLMQSLTITCIVSILWAFIGYSLAFGPGASETHDKKDDKGAVVKDDKGVPVPETLPIFPANFIGGTKYACLDYVITDPGQTKAEFVTDDKGVITQKTVPGSLVPSAYPTYCGSINHGSYMLFQLMFAIITPALICGGYAERMKFSTMCIFSALWLILVYCPLAHMMWGENGYFNWATPGAMKSPMFDFAGGTVVHISSGIAALMCALFLGKRKGYPMPQMQPHNVPMSFIGACLLWVGWFGFNAGSALQANGLAVLAFANTHFATAAAALGWPLAEWILRGKPTVLGGISGAVAGLVAITPASGFVTPMGAIALGFIAGVLCMITATYMKKALGFYDDSLDAFGVHAIGGIWGAIATGIFFNIDANPGLLANNPDLYNQIGSHAISHFQLIWNQAKGAGVAILLSAGMTSLILVVLKYTIGLRPTAEQEEEGLDLSQHGEEAYARA